VTDGGNGNEADGGNSNEGDGGNSNEADGGNGNGVDGGNGKPQSNEATEIRRAILYKDFSARLRFSESLRFAVISVTSVPVISVTSVPVTSVTASPALRTSNVLRSGTRAVR
jgi:hypothetical protein